MRILLVEDDRGLGAAVRDQIAAEGHTPDWVETLADADACTGTIAYDLILLDLMLPDGSGIDFLRRYRAQGAATPVIILTARDRITDRIAGLNAGADDYMVKPFDLAELSARIGAVARRYAGNPNPLIELGRLSIDLTSRAITGPDGAINLSQREWVIFEALLKRPNTIVSKSQIEEQLYSFDAEVESNTIEVYVSRLRKKLGHGAIETLRGLGYRLGRP
ncbi:response regulator transcription factor [Paracoccaceae bacterium Fryx2]|nr:response regulator transcription factor [Paracoccaceae bacterium Fryx2]